MENRDHQAIIKDILSVSSETSDGLRITQLMQYVDLTSQQARFYILELTQKGLITYNDITRRYPMTPKGARYLKVVNHLYELLNRQFP